MKRGAKPKKRLFKLHKFGNQLEIGSGANSPSNNFCEGNRGHELAARRLFLVLFSSRFRNPEVVSEDEKNLP